jgi:hypothetical protein
MEAALLITHTVQFSEVGKPLRCLLDDGPNLPISEAKGANARSRSIRKMNINQTAETSETQPTSTGSKLPEGRITLRTNQCESL